MPVCVCVCVRACDVNATCDLVSILADSIQWREALEHKSTRSLILDVKKSPRARVEASSFSITGHLCYITASMRERMAYHGVFTANSKCLMHEL